MKSLLFMFFYAFLIFSISCNVTVHGGNNLQKRNKDFRGGRNISEPLIVLKCNDFIITGTGDNAEWKKPEWNNLSKLDTGGRNYQSAFKILYSAKGIYILFKGEDDKITTKPYNDFESIFNGDVFEVFFHPDPKIPVYFEYEINQLNKQLILSLNKSNGQINSWAPKNYHDESEVAVKRKVYVTDEHAKIDEAIKQWSAELFFPYAILGLMPKIPPISGAVWNANFCRLDYDSGNMIKYSWTSAIQTSFHEIEKFRSIQFE